MTLALTYAKAEEAVAYALGWDRTSNNWSTDRDNLFGRILREGLGQIELPPPLPGEKVSHSWSFLAPFASIELTPSYATGTVAIASGVVTLTSGTFPSWAAQGDVWIVDDGATRRYTVNTRDSDTQVTLDDTGVAVSSGTSYTLRRHFYNLPTDFGGIETDSMNYRRDTYSAPVRLFQVGEAETRRVDREWRDYQYPFAYALVPVAGASTWQITFAPLTYETGFVEYRYKVNIADWTSGTYPYGQPQHGETILAYIVDAAYRIVHQSEEKRPYFMQLLQRSVYLDRANYKPSNMGQRSNWASDWQGIRHGYSSIDDTTFSFS